jgi:Na+/proline symporter
VSPTSLTLPVSPPLFPVFSDPLSLSLSSTESNAGLVPAAVAQELMGAGGGFLLMLQLWMAVTATANSEQLAVASLITYDVYRTYINPKVRL